MSVRVYNLLAQVNWREARKELGISAGAVALLKEIATKQFDDSNSVYLSQEAWLNLTGRSKSNFYERLGELTSTDLVLRLVKGSNTNSTRAKYRINEIRVASLPRIVRNTGQTDIGLVLDREPPSPVVDTELSGQGEAKRRLRLNTTVSFKVSEARFQQLIIDSLPFHLRHTIINGRDLDQELSQLLSAGYSDKQIKDKLNTEKQWQGIHTPYPHVRKFLATLWKEKPVAIKSERVDYVDTPSEPTPMPADFKAQMNKLFKKPD